VIKAFQQTVSLQCSFCQTTYTAQGHEMLITFSCYLLDEKFKQWLLLTEDSPL